MYTRFVNYDMIGQRYGINPFDIPKKFTRTQIGFILTMMNQEAREQERQINKAKRSR